jgi:hypothetical protein
LKARSLHLGENFEKSKFYYRKDKVNQRFAPEDFAELSVDDFEFDADYVDGHSASDEDDD